MEPGKTVLQGPVVNFTECSLVALPHLAGHLLHSDGIPGSLDGACQHGLQPRNRQLHCQLQVAWVLVQPGQQ